VDARAGTAEAIPVADGTVQAVFVGEAFHWFGTTAACCEIARVLAARGGPALLWNGARWSEAELSWLPAFRALVQPLQSAANAYPAEGARGRAALDASGLFAPMSRADADHVHRITADDFVALVASSSWIPNLPGDRRDAVLARVRALVAGRPEIALRYRTGLHGRGSCRRRSGARARAPEERPGRLPDRDVPAQPAEALLQVRRPVRHLYDPVRRAVVEPAAEDDVVTPVRAPAEHVRAHEVHRRVAHACGGHGQHLRRRVDGRDARRLAGELCGPRARTTGELEHVARGCEGLQRGVHLAAAGGVDGVVAVLGRERPVVADLLGEQPVERDVVPGGAWRPSP
jgi:hypothetical protein